jgi:predicted transposase YbfD/YdcC
MKSIYYQELVSICSQFPDSRDPVKRTYPLPEIVFLSYCGLCAGCEAWSELHAFAVENEDFLREYLPYASGIPSADTIARVFSLLSPALFEEIFAPWWDEFCGGASASKRIIAIDGKTLRGSHDRASGKSALHALHAYAAESGILLGFREVDSKTNEISVIPEMLDVIDVEGSIVTLDAMGCQRDICRKIGDAGGDYVIGLKGNQGTLSDDVRLLLEQMPQEMSRQTMQDTDAGHGRVEIRHVTVTEDISYLCETHGWPYLKSVIKVTRERYHKAGKKSDDTETSFYISSLPADASVAGHAVRAHWAVENKLHWVLDVTMREDAIRVRIDNATENLAMLRRVALNSLKSYQKTLKKSISFKLLQKKCAWNNKTLRAVISEAIS